MAEVEKLIKAAQITPTPMRVMVYKCLLNAGCPLSLDDIETKLESVDKSTISRSLSLFRDRHLVHSFNDGSGSTKYELCAAPHALSHEDLHVHFRCEECGETLCFPSIKVPEVSLPDGFESREVNYIITGVCAQCTKKR